jgi:DNA-binding MarR family transcriptional regulator
MKVVEESNKNTDVHYSIDTLKWNDEQLERYAKVVEAFWNIKIAKGGAIILHYLHIHGTTINAKLRVDTNLHQKTITLWVTIFKDAGIIKKIINLNDTRSVFIFLSDIAQQKFDYEFKL